MYTSRTFYFTISKRNPSPDRCDRYGAHNLQSSKVNILYRTAQSNDKLWVLRSITIRKIFLRSRQRIIQTFSQSRRLRSISNPIHIKPLGTRGLGSFSPIVFKCSQERSLLPDFLVNIQGSAKFGIVSLKSLYGRCHISVAYNLQNNKVFCLFICPHTDHELMSQTTCPMIFIRVLPVRSNRTNAYHLKTSVTNRCGTSTQSSTLKQRHSNERHRFRRRVRHQFVQYLVRPKESRRR